MQDNYRLTISDGTSSSFAILLFPLNNLIKNCKLLRDSIIQMDQYTCIESPIAEIQKLIQISELTILEKEPAVEITADSSPLKDVIGGNENLETKLTLGCFEAIVQGENIENPVVQFSSWIINEIQ